MANCAYYELSVFGSKENIERFLRITKGKDEKYIIYAFDQSDTYNELNDCGDNRFSMGFFGEIKWSSSYLAEPSDIKFDKSTGKKVITWLDASRLFNLTMEWYCEECGSMFQEYHSVSNGINLCSDSIYWSNPGEFCEMDHKTNIESFEDEVKNALDEGIPLDMSQVEEIRANGYELLEKRDCFSFGGYWWDKHSEDEILEMIEPVVMIDIRRL